MRSSETERTHGGGGGGGFWSKDELRPDKRPLFHGFTPAHNTRAALISLGGGLRGLWRDFNMAPARRGRTGGACAHRPSHPQQGVAACAARHCAGRGGLLLQIGCETNLVWGGRAWQATRRARRLSPEPCTAHGLPGMLSGQRCMSGVQAGGCCPASKGRALILFHYWYRLGPHCCQPGSGGGGIESALHAACTCCKLCLCWPHSQAIPEHLFSSSGWGRYVTVCASNPSLTKA